MLHRGVRCPDHFDSVSFHSVRPRRRRYDAPFFLLRNFNTDMLAGIHPNEPERLKTLLSYEILDTRPEVEFDEITALAAGLTDCPVALVSLVDDTRQWFKSSHGFDTAETPIDMAICAHALSTEDFLEIGDLAEDPRTRDNPLVCAGPLARFYAGALLRAPNGLAIGTLCVLDYRPRRLTPLQRDALRVLARQVMVRIEHARALRDADLMRKEIDHRTKNSLQSVSSLIRLQRRAAREDETRAALDKALLHIEGVASLHAELYRGSDDDRICLSRLTDRLAELMGAQLPENICLTVDMEKFEIGSRRASGFGVMVNEFVSNSVKHGFPGGAPGQIRIEGRVLSDGTYAMTLSDDGAGFADGADENLGMKVLRGAATGLGAETTALVSQDGVRLDLVIPGDDTGQG